MTKISWGSPGKRYFEYGVDRGVFYPQEGPGVAWPGLLNISEEPIGGATPILYMDGVPFRSQKTKEDFGVILQALTCPQEFEEYEGSPGLLTHQGGRPFGLSYRTRVGSDTEGLEHAYKIHLVYNALAMPSSVEYKSPAPGSPNVSPFSWKITAKPVDIPGVKPSAHLIVDTSVAYPEAVAAIEDVLYGTDSVAPRLPNPKELLDLFEQHAILVIIDHGDGTWSAIGPDDVVYMTDANTFEINWPSVVYLDEDTYQVSSL